MMRISVEEIGGLRGGRIEVMLCIFVLRLFDVLYHTFLYTSFAHMICVPCIDSRRQCRDER